MEKMFAISFHCYKILVNFLFLDVPKRWDRCTAHVLQHQSAWALQRSRPPRRRRFIV